MTEFNIAKHMCDKIDNNEAISLGEWQMLYIAITEKDD